MLLYIQKHGARRFQCILLAHKKNRPLRRPCQSQLRVASTASFQGSDPNGSRTGQRKHRLSELLQSLQSQDDEAAGDASHGERVPDISRNEKAQSPLRTTEQKVDTSTAPDFALRSNLETKDQAQIEREQEVLEALHDEDPHRLLEALAQASKYFRYFRDLPTPTLSEIIFILQPAEFIDREKAIYQELHPDHIVDLGHGTPQLASLFENYANSMERLMSDWRKSGKRFGLKEYKALLNVARAVGNGPAADSIWKDLSRENIQLDTEAVNLFMEARCWSGAYNPGYNHTLRVIKMTQEMRSQPADEERSPESGFETFRVGVSGIRTEMINTFDDVIAQGLNPDADTFMHLMVAMGREGDLAGVKSILQRVWAVDVDEIVGAQEQLPERSTIAPVTSPLHPSERLLYMVAHIFGSNNDASTALRVVDFISYKYEMPIDLKTWQELVSWTYTLSAPRSQGPEEKKVDLRTGQLPITAFSDLWKIMRSPPYNVQPTMMMHFQRVSNLRRRAFLQPMLNAMREMRGVHQTQVQRYKECMMNHIQSKLRRPLDPLKKPFFSKGQQHDALEQSADLRLERLAEFREFTCMKRALGYLLAVNRWTSRHGAHFYNVLWQRIGVHNAIDEFGCYMDRFGFKYQIRTGKVHIQPIKVAMAVDQEETDVPGVHAVMGTGVYRNITSKYERYGSLANTDWDDVVFEDDEEEFGDELQESWPMSEMQDGNQQEEDNPSLLELAEDSSDLSYVELLDESLKSGNSLPPPST